MTFVPGVPELGMAVKRYRRYSTEFKLRLVEGYLAGEGSAKGLATEHGICHSLILIWAERYRKGELTLDVQRALDAEVARNRPPIGECPSLPCHGPGPLLDRHKLGWY